MGKAVWIPRDASVSTMTGVTPSSVKVGAGGAVTTDPVVSSTATTPEPALTAGSSGSISSTVPSPSVVSTRSGSAVSRAASSVSGPAGSAESKAASGPVVSGSTGPSSSVRSRKSSECVRAGPLVGPGSSRPGQTPRHACVAVGAVRTGPGHRSVTDVAPASRPVPGGTGEPGDPERSPTNRPSRPASGPARTATRRGDAVVFTPTVARTVPAHRRPTRACTARTGGVAGRAQWTGRSRGPQRDGALRARSRPVAPRPRRSRRRRPASRGRAPCGPCRR